MSNISIDNSKIIFDTSSICKMYDMTDDSKNIMIRVLDFLKDKIWIPGHAYVEYKRNRIKVIKNPLSEKYVIPGYFSNDSLKAGRKYLERLDNSDYYHPFISSAVRKELSEDLEKAMRLISCVRKGISDEFDERRKEILALVDNDIIRDVIETLPRGNDYSFSEMLELCQVGEMRYRNSIPPGYMDRGKTGLRIYGDLFVWNQILDFSETNPVDVIFIINDDKEDWWEDFKKGIFREELILEFQEKSGCNIHPMTLEKFISLLESYYKDEEVLPFFKGLEAVRETLEKASSSKSFNERYAVFKCCECGHIQKEKLDEFIWDWIEDGWSENDMGPETQYDDTEVFKCEECGADMELRFQLSEYPAGRIEDLICETQNCELQNEPDFISAMEIPFRRDDVKECEYCGRKVHGLTHGMCDICLDEFNYKINHD